MQKTVVSLFSSALVTLMAATSNASVVGSWEGAIQLQQLALTIEVTFIRDEDRITARISIPQQAAFDLDLQNVRIDAPQVYFELVAAPGLARFRGDIRADDLIKGSFEQAGVTAPFFLRRSTTDAPSNPLDESTVRVALPIEGGELVGSLLVPEAVKSPPAALLIQGSGPTDRDGNSPAQGVRPNSMKLLAEALHGHNIASLRFDKRGVAESLPDGFAQENLRFDTYVADVVHWLTYLSHLDRFSYLALIGHSEGVLLATLAATQVEDVKCLVSVAGAGIPADQALMQQLRERVGPELIGEVQKILDVIRADSRVDVSGELRPLFDISVQPYLHSWFQYDPAVEIQRLAIPTLIVYGTEDLQIAPADGVLLDQAAQDSTLLQITGMNHVLKQSAGTLAQQLPSYSDPNLPLHPELAAALSKFIHGCGG